jgi:2'-5' RNA ligase
MTRVFFGLELDTATTLKIADWRDRQIACDGRPVPTSNFHLTLAFVGELSESAIERLCLAVDDWLTPSNIRGATLNLDCTGYWAKTGIFWLGATSWPDQLDQMTGKLGNLAGSVGAKRDKRSFQPHVTLYRRCQTAPVAPLDVPNIALDYRHCTLFESRQGRHGVSYHALQDWDFLPGAD